MDIRQLTDRYAVSPQIEPSDCAALAEAGFTTLIANRPDAEVPPSHQLAAMETAARAAGLDFVALPVTMGTITLDLVETQAKTLADAKGSVLAYCASGTRSTIVWALGQAPQHESSGLIAAAAAHGYDLTGLKSQLDAFYQKT